MNMPHCAAVLLVAVAAEASPLSKPIVNPANGHTYILLDAATWADSEKEAVSLGGHLATLRSQAEEDWLVNTFGSYQGQQRLLWIGLSDVDQKYHFSWSSGESLSFTCWAEGEPNDAGHGEDFVSIYYPGHSQGGKWNDWHDRTADPIGLPMNGVVELVPAAPRALSQPAAEVPLVTLKAAEVVAIHGTSVLLQWPASASGYMLEATTNLAQPFTMFGYSEKVDAAAGTVSVVVTNPGAQMFFRLRKP